MERAASNARRVGDKVVEHRRISRNTSCDLSAVIVEVGDALKEIPLNLYRCQLRVLLGSDLLLMRSDRLYCSCRLGLSRLLGYRLRYRNRISLVDLSERIVHAKFSELKLRQCHFLSRVAAREAAIAI